MDKIIGKKVLRIMGNVLAANNMRLPRKNSPSPSLGLTGRYIYTQVRTVPDKYYVLHLFIQAKDDSVMDMSITNLFKETRVIGNVLQFPCNLSPKWTTICVDMVQVLQQHKGLPFKCLKGIQVCSNLFVRNAFTTDVLHTAATLPKDFAFPLPQGRELDSFYDWVSITEGPAGSENASPNMALAEQMRIHKLMSSSKPARTSYHVGAGGMGGVNTSSSGRNHTFADETRTTDAPPNPALEMRWCIGHTGKSPHSMLWSNDSRWILYPCSSLIVAMNPEMSEQRFFIGHTGDVTVMAMGPNDELLASCQEGKCPLIRLWNFATGDCVGLVTAHGRDVSCIGFNRDASKMVAVGKDDKGAGRNFLNSVVVWDLAKVAQGGKAVKIAEHTFGPSLNKIAFCPFDDGHLVSCGDDNIHLWRIKAVHKKEELRKIALPLGPHGGENFLDIAFEGTLGSADPLSRKIYASTGTGLVYQINYTNRCVEQIYRLHDAGIKALVVTDGFCVTGSDDRFLRVWPLDFSDYFLEAQHAAPVTSVGVSSDSLKIAISTQNGTVGVMDVPSHGYRTVVRSHENSVCAMAMDPNNREFTTTAADGTIRTWDLDSYDQLYEFLAPGECARCVEYHPSLYVIACGFDNGAVRIFDMASTSQLHEYRQHQGRVMALAFSPDGSRLFSAATDGHFCVYDAPRNYQPIKTVACSHAGDDVAIALSPDGKLLTALGVHGSSILVLDTANMDKVAEIPVLGRTLSLLRFAPTTGELLAVTSDSRLHR
jgi:WD40 repeat protein